MALLSDVKAKAATISKGKTQKKLSDSGGLYLLVKQSGKYWRLDYRFGDKRKTMAWLIAYYRNRSAGYSGTGSTCRKTRHD